jgi:DNA polymerase-3 subunit epsilon
MLKLADLDGTDRIVAIDIETTGHAMKTEAEIARMPKGMRLPGIVIQVGCVDLLRDGTSWRKGESWETLVQPDGPVHPESIKVHGIKPFALAKAPRFPEIVGKLEAFVGGSVLLAHAASNEIDFLNYEMFRAKLATRDAPPYGPARFLDTQVMSWELFPGASGSLDVLLDRLWVDRSDRFAFHGALLDADLTADAFVKMHDGFVVDEVRSFSA